MKITRTEIRKIISEAFTQLSDRDDPYSWGALNMFLRNEGQGGQFFFASPHAGSFKGEAKSIQTMETKDVVFPVLDPVTKQPILDSQGNVVFARGKKDVKAIKELGRFSGEVYVIPVRHDGVNYLHLTLDNDLYQYFKGKGNNLVKVIDPGVWIKESEANYIDRVRGNGINSLEYHIYKIAVNAGIIEEYPFNEIAKKMPAFKASKGLGVQLSEDPIERMAREKREQEQKRAERDRLEKMLKDQEDYMREKNRTRGKTIVRRKK